MNVKISRKLIKYFHNKTILITGGTGSVGQLIVDVLTKLSVRKIKIFSRDEQKQFEMHNKFEAYLSKLDFIIGDVRDEASSVEATKNVDIIYHCAALKHVPICEDFPLEAIKTNTLAAISLIKAAELNQVERVVVISTDKAVRPVNVMGMTKALQEKIFLSNRINSKTRFICVRFGNVVGSRGSVVPLFKERLENNKPLLVTDKNMTRFLITPEDAVTLVLKATLEGQHGQIYIRKTAACRIIDLAKVMIKEIKSVEQYPIKFVGIRPGEQLYESLVSEEEMKRISEENGYLIIDPHWVIRGKTIPGNFSDYRSDMVRNYMTLKDIKACLKGDGWI